MSDLLKFSVNQGVIECDCMERTHSFISNNLRYLNKAMVTIKDSGLKSNKLTFVCLEDNMIFGTKIDKVELGHIAQAEGVLREGGVCRYDEVLDSIK